jgi:hypothetical protein
MKIEFLGKDYQIVTINWLGSNDIVVIFQADSGLKIVQMSEKEFKNSVKF